MTNIKTKIELTAAIIFLWTIFSGSFEISQATTYSPNNEIRPTTYDPGEDSTIMPEIDIRASALRVI